MRKKRWTELIAALFLSVSLLCFAACGGDETGDSSETGYSAENEVTAAEPAQVQKETAAGIVTRLSEGEAGAGSEWSIIALARSPLAKEPEAVAVFNKYQENIRVEIKRAEGVLNPEQPTDNAKAAIALKMLGEDPSDIEGFDLLKQLEDEDAARNQGINGEIWALTAAGCCERKLDCADAYVEDILKMQGEDGGFTFDGKTADVDITAMAVQALSVYDTGNEQAAEAVDQAMAWLSGQQSSDGSFGNAESTAQVVIAAGCMGEDVSAMEDFVQSGKSLTDGLMKYRFENGFRHKDEEEVNDMATEQALCALDALILSESGESLF